MMAPTARALFRVVLFSLFGTVLSRGASSPVSVELDDKGVEKILWQGRNYSADGNIAIQLMRVEDKDGKPRDVQGKLIDYRTDPSAKKVVADYEGGTLTCTYDTKGNRVDLYVEVTNKTEWPCVYLRLKLGELALLKDRANQADDGGTKAVDNSHIFGFRRLLAEDAVIALGNWEVASPVSVNTGREIAAGQPIIMETPLVESQPSHPIVESRLLALARRVIAPGATDRFHLSFNLAAPGAGDSELCPEILRHVAQERPMRLHWPDRRPIGTLFIATANMHWPTNPRGFVFGKGKNNDVTTEVGREEFRKALLAYADNSVKVLKEMDAQGVIVWDIEGQEYYHPLSYLGDPRNLKETTPEMEGLADEFFKKFTDAGLKVGITIRPTRVIKDPENPGKLRQTEVPNPLEEMSEKIAYAKKRWGVSIIYLDSNVFGRSWLTKEQVAQMKGVPFVLPVSMMEELHRRYPDILIIPEWSGPKEYVVTAPYQSANLKQRATPSDVRKIYPEAFSVVAAPNGQDLEQNLEVYSKAVTAGDVLLFLAWYHSPANELIKLIYDEAGFRKKGCPADVKGASLETLTSLAAGEDTRTKYYVAETLAGSKDPRAISVLSGLLGDPNFLVRKNAIISLGKLHPLSPELANRMMDILRDPKTGMLAPFAADTLGKLGPAAVPSILELLNGSQGQMQYYGVRAVKTLPSLDPAVVQQTLALLASPNATLREAVIETMGERKVTDAVPQLMEILNDENETLSIAAVRALGEIADQRAIEPLVKLYDREYRSIVVYGIKGALDTALRQVTGEKDSRDAAGWRAWSG